MSNVLRIAKKEYVDFISNPLVLIVLFSYVIYNILYINQFVNYVNQSRIDDLKNIGVAANLFLLFTLTWTCSLVGIIIGCSTISSERMGNAISTLITKPVYRDTIINGKIVGAILFLASIILFIILLSTAILLILCGNTFSQYIISYFSNLPYIFVFSLAYVMLFLSISMLISLLVREQAFAMIISFLTIVISNLMYTANIVLNIDNVIPGFDLGNLCSILSPEGTIYRIGSIFVNESPVPQESFTVILPEIYQFLIFAIIITFISYIIFIRRDIS